MFKVEETKELGRFLVAGEDIEARTLLIFEEPLVSAPADDEDEEQGEFPMCLGCFKRLNNSCFWRSCKGCGWPVCGETCEAAESHSMECQIFAEYKVKYPPKHSWPILNKTILILRTLLLQKLKPMLWKTLILTLEHHTTIRQSKAYCQNEDSMILDNFSEFFSEKSDSSTLFPPEYRTPELIVRISGVINVNAFSTNKSGFGGTNSVRMVLSIYPQATLLTHSCIPNCTWTVENDIKISIRAATPIKKGEMITIAYSMPEAMSGTLQRLISMEDAGHFVCYCGRCSDPTELGTYTSAVKCSDCEDNWLLPEVPTNPESLWKCGGCGGSRSVRKIVFILKQIEEKYENIITKSGGSFSREKEVELLEELVWQLGGRSLHENHYILQEIHTRIIKLQWNVLEKLKFKEIDQFVGHCRKMLKIADVLFPGFSKTRALLQFFLSQGLFQIASLSQKSTFLEESGQTFENLELGEIYKEIYYLQTRALLFFNDMQEHSSRNQQNINHSASNQFAKCIKRQLQNVEKYIT